MSISSLEKKFLTLVMLIASLSLLFLTFALVCEKINHGENVCVINMEKPCSRAYYPKLAFDLAFYGICLDILLSVFLFLASIASLFFGKFNGRILIKYISLLSTKAIISFTVTLFVLTNQNYCFGLVVEFFNHVVHGTQMDDISSYTFYTISFVTVSCLASIFGFIVSIFEGYRMIRVYEEKHNEAVWAKWDQMTAELATY